MKKTKVIKENPLKIDMSFEEAIQKIVTTPKKRVEEIIEREKSKNKPKVK